MNATSESILKRFRRRICRDVGMDEGEERLSDGEAGERIPRMWFPSYSAIESGSGNDVQEKAKY